MATPALVCLSKSCMASTCVTELKYISWSYFLLLCYVVSECGFGSLFFCYLLSLLLFFNAAEKRRKQQFRNCMEEIHMITGQLVGIFDDPFFIYIHKNFLCADCTNVGQISCWCATDVVKLSRSSLQEKKIQRTTKYLLRVKMHIHILDAIKDKGSRKMGTVVLVY